MQLLELEPQFLRYDKRENGVHLVHVESLTEADGIFFVCPKCFAANGGSRIGVHGVICWFEDRVPDDARPGPGRWKPQGTGYVDLSFVPGKHSNSVRLTAGCAWHGFVQNGQAT
jgi:hypothetical protein